MATESQNQAAVHETSPSAERATTGRRAPVSVVIRGERRTIAEWAQISGKKPQAIAALWRKGKRGAELFAPRVRSSCDNFPAGILTTRSAKEWDSVEYELDLHAQRCVEFAVEQGGLNLDQIGAIMGDVSRERIRQVEEIAMRKIRRLSERARNLSNLPDAARWDWFVRAIQRRQLTKREALALVDMVAYEIVHGCSMFDLEALSQMQKPSGWTYPATEFEHRE